MCAPREKSNQAGILWAALSRLVKLCVLPKDQSGNVVMMFAVVAIPLIAAIGLAIDTGRVYHVSMATQGALDAAALAAGRVAQIEKTDTMSKASKAASAYFDQAKPTDVVTVSIAFSPNAQQTEFTVTATTWVKTPFLSALNLVSYKGSEDGAPSICKGNYYACAKVVTRATAGICLNCTPNREGTNLEISMMLDVTGSMSGDKIVDLIAAAKDFIDIVVWDDQSQFASRVALAPFAPAVNVGDDYFTLITGKGGKSPDSATAITTARPAPTKAMAKCVVERTGAEQATDAAPTGAGTWLPTWNDATGSTSTTCTPSAKIVPLTKDRGLLKTTIDGFKVSGSTAGQLGTAFAWYLLSPNWNNVWPLASRPTPYGTPNVQKIAVLMTDGIYNTLQGKSYSDTGGDAMNALNQAVSLCTAMKTKAITIYTVGFDLQSTDAKNMLKSCASSSDTYYDVSSGDQLKAAFRDIALKVTTLRLIN